MSGIKIKGSILKYCRDEFGEIFVAENDETRSLYFGDGILQSSLRLDSPGSIIDTCNQTMLSCLLFLKEPCSVLLIGLGGCSLVHFLLRTFPCCAVDVVEIRKQVIDLAHEYFLLPKQNPKLRIFHAAGQDFVRQQAEENGNYDLIIVDAFDEQGPAAALSETPFIDTCRSRLKEGGICVMNLWNRPKDDFPRLHAAFQEVFGGNTLKVIPDEKCWNVIVFGFAGPVDFGDLASYRQKARIFEEAYHINFPKFLKCVSWQNSG